jgi:hypothetical protein
MRGRWGFVVAGILLVAGPAAAEEVLHLTAGGTMLIRSHRVENGMIHVDLGGNALLAFPAASVERITNAGKDVYLSPSFQRANVAGGTGDVSAGGEEIVTSAPISGEGSVPSRYRGEARRSRVPVDDAMAAAGAPLAGGATSGATPSARRLQAYGNRQSWGASKEAVDPHRDSMAPNASGKMTIEMPVQRSGGAPAEQVRRFLPSERMADAAIAEGQVPVPDSPPTVPESSDPAGD